MKKIAVLFTVLLLTFAVSYAQRGRGGFSRGGGGGSFRNSGFSRGVVYNRSVAGVHGYAGYRGGYYGGYRGGYYGGYRGYYGGWPYFSLGLGFGWPYYYGYPYYSPYYSYPYYGNGYGYDDSGYYDAPQPSRNAPPQGSAQPPLENSYNEKNDGGYYNNDTIYSRKPAPAGPRTDAQGRTWIEPHWKHTDEGWIWIEGYWKKQQ